MLVVYVNKGSISSVKESVYNTEVHGIIDTF